MDDDALEEIWAEVELLLLDLLTEDRAALADRVHLIRTMFPELDDRIVELVDEFDRNPQL